MPDLLLAAVAFVAALVIGRAWGAFGTLQHGKHCPTCGRRALPLTHRTFPRVKGRFLERRWCPACGWEGLRRRRRYRIHPAGQSDGASGFRWAHPRQEERPLLWNDPEKRREE